MASICSVTCDGVSRSGSGLSPPRPPPPRPELVLLGAYCAFTTSSSRRLAGGVKFTGITAALPTSTTLPLTLDWLAFTHSSISALVGPNRAGPPRPGNPPGPPRPAAAAVSVLSAAGPRGYPRGGPCGGTSWMAEAVTVPLVEGVHASTSNFRFSRTGDTINALARSLLHPGWPNSHGSRWAFLSPQAVSCLTTQFAAASWFGEPVTRGPYRSARHGLA